MGSSYLRQEHGHTMVSLPHAACRPRVFTEDRTRAVLIMFSMADEGNIDWLLHTALCLLLSDSEPNSKRISFMEAHR